MRITVGRQQHAELPVASRPASSRTPRTGKRQRYWHDFFNYAGLHRTVWLYATAQARIDDVTVVTGLDGSHRHRRLRASRPRAPTGSRCGSSCATPTAREVATGTGASGTLTVPDVHRWAPGDGYLYDLEVQLVDDGGAVVDSYHQSVGVRTVEVRRHRSS